MVSLGTQPANRKSGFGHSSPTGARAQDLSRQPARPDLWGARVSVYPTAYLLNGGTLERAQAIAAHESPRTTKLYDRTDDEVTIEDIEKIGI